MCYPNREWSKFTLDSRKTTFGVALFACFRRLARVGIHREETR
jgi:hypothetical protein